MVAQYDNGEPRTLKQNFNYINNVTQDAFVTKLCTQLNVTQIRLNSNVVSSNKH